MSVSQIASKYSLDGPRAALPVNPMAPGHPPRQISSATSSSCNSFASPTTSLPSNKSANEIVPFASPLSQIVIGRIVSRAIRPVPVCRISRLASSSSTRGGTALPVRTNNPRSWASSTAARTASQSEGTSCHSSIKRGYVPFNNLSVLCCANSRFAAPFLASARKTELLTICFDVVVLPHHLAPRTRTAPIYASFSASSTSAILRLYSLISLKIVANI